MEKEKQQAFYLKEIERLYLEHQKHDLDQECLPEAGLLKQFIQTIRDIEKKQSKYAMQADELTDITEKAMDNQEVIDNLNYRINTLNREAAVFREAFFVFFEAYHLLSANLFNDSAICESHGTAIHQQREYLEKKLSFLGVVTIGKAGETFCESLHTIEEVVYDTEYPEGTVTSVIISGLVFGGVVLHKAIVKVSGTKNNSVGDRI